MDSVDSPQTSYVVKSRKKEVPPPLFASPKRSLQTENFKVYVS